MAVVTSGRAPADNGFFGPGSITWRVHTNPAILVGALRALMIQALHPLAMAGVAQYSDFRTNPLKRLRGTARYVHTVVFGDRQTARAAAESVKKLHQRVRGVDPITGREFSASDPETLLWVHCVEIHSFLAAYRAYGGHLTRAEQDRYLAEQVTSAELIGIPREMVPDSVDAYRAYFASVLPRLCCGADAAATIAFVRRPRLPGSWPHRAAMFPSAYTLGRAAVALVPRTLRPMAGLPDRGPADVSAALAVVLASRALLMALQVRPMASWVEHELQHFLGIGPLPAAARSHQRREAFAPSLPSPAALFDRLQA
jgi:uncharacterized protein (DUF2236 family)